MPIRIFNRERQQQLLDPQTAMRAGSPAKLAGNAVMKLLGMLNDYPLQWAVQNELHHLLPVVKSEPITCASNNPTCKRDDPSGVDNLTRGFIYFQLRRFRHATPLLFS
jgi:hypothetical protein